MNGNCCNCGSPKVIRDVDLQMSSASAGVDISVLTGAQLSPDSWWDKKPIVPKVTKCDLCCACGAVLMKIENPGAIWEALQASRGSGR